MSEYLNLVNDRYIYLVKSPIVHPRFKVELLDNSETNVLMEITNDIDVNSGSISINYQQGIRMSCSFSIINSEGKYNPSPETGILWINSKFRLYVGIYDPKNEDIYWFSEGVYYITNPTNEHRFSDKKIDVQGVDKFAVFGSELGYNQLTSTYLIESGQKIYSVIKDILMLDIGNGSVIDSVEPLFDPKYKDEILPYDINKEQGGYLSDILIELANILGANIYYDKNGRLNVESGTTDISYSEDSPIWEFKEGDYEYMGSSVTYDYTNVLNVVTVVGNNVAAEDLYQYTAENNNPLSPTRIDYIGRKEAQLIETPMAYDLDRAKEYAEFQLNRLSILQQSIDFSCPIIPHLDVDVVCNVTDIYLEYQEHRFIIQSVTIPFNVKSLMSISACNIASLPYYDLLEGGT